ncbi:MAG TPA: voltage-gated chloride channel protein [Clostridiales bacterium]|nr:voltage-gated chloride channel protein [Clostridiales bacterium]
MKKIKTLICNYSYVLLLGIIAAGIGVITGTLDALFGRVLLWITSFRENNAVFLIPFLALAGACIIYFYNRFGKNSINGMSLIFKAGHGDSEKIPLRLIPFVMLSTWITHLFGGSAGREGVAVQIGAVVGHRVGGMIPVNNAPRILLIAGMAAGFGGLFQTPIAAVFFALEVLSAGKLLYDALLPALVASYISALTAGFLGLKKFSIILTDNVELTWLLIIQIVIMAIIFGIIGGLFAHILHRLKDKFAKWFVNPIKRIVIFGIIISVCSLICYMGRYSGLGTNLIADSFNGNVYSYDWLLKFAFTIVTLACGFQGGEVTPLFAIGATLGVVISSLLGFPVLLGAALGYAAVFGSASNTLLAPIFIGAEIFGFRYIPLFFIVCTIAYVFNGNKSIYGLQKKKAL